MAWWQGEMKADARERQIPIPHQATYFHRQLVQEGTTMKDLAMGLVIMSKVAIVVYVAAVCWTMWHTQMPAIPLVDLTVRF